jgi:hypothetical protein
MNTMHHCLVIIPPAPPGTTPHWSLRTPAAGLQTKPIRIPKVCFVPVEGGLQNNNIISQEAINFLTKCVWEKVPNICTPNKLCPTTAPSC